MKGELKSQMPSSKKSDNPKNVYLKPGWQIPVILPVILLALEIAGVFLCLVLLQSPARRQPKAPDSKNLGFVFAQKTSSWLNQNLTLNSAGKSFNLTSDIPFWQQRSLFSYSDPITTPALPRRSISEIVLNQLGPSNPWQAFGQNQTVWGFDFAAEKIYNKLLSEVAPQIEREAQDAALEIVSGRATVFQPDLAGLSLDYPKTIGLVKEALFRGNSIIEASVVSSFPTVRLKNLNDLGIEELVAHGESDFTGSSKNRITNISVGAARFNGLILKPGEEFSFNQNLGEVTAEGGFKPEIVIKPEGQVPELGGGLCQVSTTAFRAALYGGLNITARRNHSFAVRYYAPQGTDATIYPGAVDFKFINDTPAHLLIATRVEDKRLIFDFYGTSDGRKVEIDGPYQYDFGEGGSMKARLTRNVTLAEQKTTKEFFSKYVSRNLFPRVEEFPKPAQAAPETPPAQTPTGETPPPTPTNPTDQPNPPTN
ncbi:MAG: VanW family protein [Patescibacteria group bacterium]